MGLFMSGLLVEFEKFPDERELIGSLLIAYGEIEFALLACIDSVLWQNLETTTRVLFRVQGEGARINVADAILRPEYQKVNLEGIWGNALGAIRLCKTIRNQYAHCHWVLIDEALHFLSFDEAAQQVEGNIDVRYRQVDVSLLQDQMAYFEYGIATIYFLVFEYEKRVGRRSSHDVELPKSMAAPPLYSRIRSSGE